MTTPIEMASSSSTDEVEMLKTRLYNYRFYHTLRTGNKMADWLANHAMDTQSTSTSTGTQRTMVATIREKLYTMTDKDTAHTWTDQLPPTNAIARIRALLHTHSPTTGPPRKRPRPIDPRAPSRNTRSRRLP
jgi:hypothetical protein